jgi:hypothetical protein
MQAVLYFLIGLVAALAINMFGRLFALFADAAAAAVGELALGVRQTAAAGFHCSRRSCSPFCLS